MICASVMLAIFLAWPMVFGSDKASAVRAAGAKVAAAAAPAASAAGSRTIQTGVRPATAPQAKRLESCFKRYEREYARCDAIDSNCRVKVADQWDLCEATGFWP
jgi:hypothetical protein